MRPDINMLKKRECARWVGIILWEEELLREYGEDWRGRLLMYLDHLHVPCALSPLHDMDEYDQQDVDDWIARHTDPDHYSFISQDVELVRKMAPVVGQKKKAHVHVIFKMPAKHNRTFYTEMMAGYLDVAETRWMRIIAFDGYLCYLCHMYEQDKVRYSVTEIVLFAGLDGSALVNMADSERDSISMYVCETIQAKGWRYFYQLNSWAVESGNPKVYNLVKGNHSYFNAILRSKREHAYDEKQKKKEEAGAA